MPLHPIDRRPCAFLEFGQSSVSSISIILLVIMKRPLTVRVLLGIAGWPGNYVDVSPHLCCKSRSMVLKTTPSTTYPMAIIRIMTAMTALISFR